MFASRKIKQNERKKWKKAGKFAPQMQAQDFEINDWFKLVPMDQPIKLQEANTKTTMNFVFRDSGKPYERF